MKRFIAGILSAVIVSGLAGCGAQSNAPASGEVSQPQTESPAAQATALEGEITGEITVSVYETMTYKNFLDAAVIAFEEKYPGTKVNVNTFSAMPEIRTSGGGGNVMRAVTIGSIDSEENEKAQNDYMTQINTEMISGGGADIYAADILPYYKYALNGQLEDLGKYMESDADFNASDYRANIFEAAKFNGGQYILPIDYSFDVLSYDSTLMDEAAQSKFSPDGKYTYEQLAEMGLDSYLNNYDADAESPLKMFNLYSDVRDVGNSFFRKVLDANYNIFVDIVNKKANFTDGTFTGMLNLAKEYEEKGYLNSRIDMSSGQFDQANMREMMRQASSQSYLYKTTSQMMLLQAFNTDDTTRVNRGFVIGGGGGITENDTLSGMQANENGEVAFSTSQAYMMNANSKNKKTAWEFIKFLLSEEMQTSLYLFNVPVNVNAAAEKTKLQITGELYAGLALRAQDFGGGGGEGRFGGGQNNPNGNPDRVAPENNAPEDAAVPEDAEEMSETIAISEAVEMPLQTPAAGDGETELTEAQQETYDRYMEAMETYTSMLNSYMIRDQIIDNMINAEVQNFFDGSRTADEVAAALQNKIDMYLKE